MLHDKTKMPEQHNMTAANKLRRHIYKSISLFACVYKTLSLWAKKVSSIIYTISRGSPTFHNHLSPEVKMGISACLKNWQMFLTTPENMDNSFGNTFTTNNTFVCSKHHTFSSLNSQWNSFEMNSEIIVTAATRISRVEFSILSFIH